MTLQEIASFIQNATRYKLSTAQIVLIIDATQKLAFDNDSKFFLVWSDFTPQFVLSFASAGYTNAVAGDIGKTVTDGTNTGVLVSYDNTLRTWNITTSTEFPDSAAVTITTGTGAGTLASADSFVGFKGPYSGPTSPPVRKIWGVTRETDARIYGNDSVILSDDYEFDSYAFNKSKFFEQAREDNIDNEITLINSPSINSTYRWLYWRNAPTISDILSASDSSLLIPSRYHMQFINACIKQANIAIYGEDLNPQDIKVILGQWWESLFRPYTPMGKASNRTLYPRQGSSVMI